MAPHQQLLEVLVVGVQLHDARRKPYGGSRLPRRQTVKRSLVQRRLGRAEQSAALAEEPRLEPRRVAEVHPLQQLAPEAGDRDRLLRRSPDQGFDVHKRARGQRKLRGPARQDRRPHYPTKLGQVPANRAERIINAREQ